MNMDMDNEDFEDCSGYVDQEYLNEELAGYEKKNLMSPHENRLMHKWVACGHSVFEPCPPRYAGSCGVPAGYDFLDVYRFDKELDEETMGMTDAERTDYLKNYFDDDDVEVPARRNGPDPDRYSDPELSKEKIRKLSRENTWLWTFIYDEGLASLASDYIKERKSCKLFR